MTLLYAQELTAQSALSPRIANYKMEVELDVEEKKIYGTTTLLWRNKSTDRVSDLYFHLYYNAFRNTQSTFFKERGVPEFLTQGIDDDCGWGWSHIISIADASGNDLGEGLSYVQPDDNNSEDKTVLRVPLANPVAPGEETYITFDWVAKIPKMMPRTGYNKDFYFFAQWFPKVGVYESAGTRYATEGGWNCHQYHSNGEYFSDFGVYDVKVTVPENFMVAASGQLIEQEKTATKEKGKTKTWHFIAEDVIDFTWSASPEFVLTEEKYKDTEIKLYSYPNKVHLKDRHLPIMKYCIEYLEEKLGPYPYSTISIVDPPIHGLYTGGMEYPTLITIMSSNSLPAGIKVSETLVAHEFIHQYFMQMVASNEVEEPWMDEGFTTYYEGKILDSYLGDQTSAIDCAGFKAGNKEWNRTEFFGGDNPQIASNARKSYQYKHGGYGPISYNKTALWLQTMENLVGESTMDEIMQTYFRRWQFKHPMRQNFLDVVNEIVIKNKPNEFPEGMDWYFEEVLYGTGLCDYKVASIKNTKVKPKRGFFSDFQNCEIQELDSEVSIYKSTVILHRLGEVKLPLEILVHFDDGHQETYQWDGKDRSSEITQTSTRRIISVEIDPEQKIYLDNNFLNNSLTIEKNHSGIRALSARFISGFQHILETISLLV